MSGVRAGDFTPVGSAPGAMAGPPRRGWIRVALGLLLVVAGVVATAVGIAQAVTEHGKIEGDAVTGADVRDGGLGDAAAFTVPAGGRRHFSVYLLFDGVESNSEVQELAVRDTGCAATMPDGVVTEFRGARQDVAATLGGAASVGHFTSLPGRVTVRCGYTSGTRSSERRRPDSVPFVVTPGKPSFLDSGVLTIVGGVGVAIAGGFLGFWGWRRRA